MTIVDLVADEIKDIFNADILALLQAYENAFPPDIAFSINSEKTSDIMDLDVEGGDIKVVGFWWNTSLSKINDLVFQDFLSRITISQGSSVIDRNFGGHTSKKNLTKDSLEAIMLLAATQSPFVKNISNLRVEDYTDNPKIVQDELVTFFDLVNILGDRVSHTLVV